MHKESVLNIFQYLASSVPIDHCKQTRAVDILKEELGRGVVPKRVLDFGCGDGRTIDLFGKLLPNCDWRGVDIESSPEVNSRTRTDPRFVTYDGLLLPFKNSEFDLVYSHHFYHYNKNDVSSLYWISLFQLQYHHVAVLV